MQEYWSVWSDLGVLGWHPHMEYLPIKVCVPHHSWWVEVPVGVVAKGEVGECCMLLELKSWGVLKYLVPNVW